MTQQLTLELDPGLPNLPARLRPMLPRPAAEPFDSPDHLFEPTWGGHRALAFLAPAVERGSEGWLTADGGPSLRLIDAGGRDVASRLPELEALALRVEARSAVLDGELVVVDTVGRPDAAALDARLDGLPGPEVAFLVFDMLYLDGAPLVGRPLSRRREALRRILRPGPEVVAVPAIATEGRALHDAVSSQGLAGVLARRRDSPYLPGIRSRLWRSIAAGPVRPAADVGSGEPMIPGPTASPTEPQTGPWAETEEANRPVGPAPVLAVFRRLPLDLEEPAP
jgi:ATP-dependent DNA ligase